MKSLEVVKTGNYTNHNGEEKVRYENIGSIIGKEDGTKFMFIKRCFNPAGVTFKDGSESILVSMFKPKEKSNNNIPMPSGDDYPDPVDGSGQPFPDEHMPF